MRIFGAAVFIFVPFGRRRKQFAIGYRAGDAASPFGGKGGGRGNFLDALGDGAVVGKLAKNPLKARRARSRRMQRRRSRCDIGGSDSAWIRTDNRRRGSPGPEAMSCFFVTYPSGLPALSSQAFLDGGRLRRRSLAADANRRPGLAEGFRFRLPGFIHRGFRGSGPRWGRRPIHSSGRLSWSRRFRLAATIAERSSIQGDGFGERDVRPFVARMVELNDAAVDIGAVAARS